MQPCARRSRNNTGSSTLLIVTQRIATIKNAEQIIVLDEGKIVGKGNHEELNENLRGLSRHCLIAAQQGGIGMSNAKHSKHPLLAHGSRCGG